MLARADFCSYSCGKKKKVLVQLGWEGWVGSCLYLCPSASGLLAGCIGGVLRRLSVGVLASELNYTPLPFLLLP